MILVRLVSGLHIDLDQLKNEATLSFTPVITFSASFLIFFHLVPFPGLIPVCDEIGAGDSGHQACAIQS